MPAKPRHPRAPKKPRQQARYDPQRGSAPPEMIELVDPAWILKAVAGVFAVALLCAYITLCVFFAHGQWQLVLHPSRTISKTPASAGLAFTEVHFGVDATGQPQIDGWFLPSAQPAAATALLLHSGDGTMADAMPAAQRLHDARVNVLVFDYRGFGHSGGLHPTEASMESDANTALTYLTTTRAVPISSIVVYGAGAGASLAVHLCAEYPALPALLLQSPDGDFEARVRRDPRSKLIPLWLLFDQPFPLKGPLRSLSTPRLLITPDTMSATVAGFIGAHVTAAAGPDL